MRDLMERLVSLFRPERRGKNAYNADRDPFVLALEAERRASERRASRLRDQLGDWGRPDLVDYLDRTTYPGEGQE